MLKFYISKYLHKSATVIENNRKHNSKVFIVFVLIVKLLKNKGISSSKKFRVGKVVKK